MNRRLLRDEDGTTLLLTIFYGVLALALILLVVAATSLYLERKRLFTLADGAALVGAEAFELDDVIVTAEVPRVELRSPDVAAAVSDYLASAPDAADFEQLGSSAPSRSTAAAPPSPSPRSGVPRSCRCWCRRASRSR
ncbi:pilus assembly protein TadG-related protein [Cryobacterium sp. BB307]|uniref:pilus assembly protein TadG-related protein n=1 Tax=Cryobacterium sp. BB307 TaxID=2716317 RepID=UPI001B2FE315|nr:pilus assembly protein TadG-related protein [Cryobacterium sp. BB307]